MQGEHAARTADRDVAEDHERVDPVLHGRIREKPNHHQGERDDHEQTLHGVVHLLDLAGPLEVRVVRQVDLLRDLLLRLRDRRLQVAVPHRELHRRVAEPILAEDDVRTVLERDRRELSERDGVAIRGRYSDLADRLDRLPVRFEPANREGEVLLPLVDVRDRLLPARAVDEARANRRSRSRSVPSVQVICGSFFAPLRPFDEWPRGVETASESSSLSSAATASVPTRGDRTPARRRSRPGPRGRARGSLRRHTDLEPLSVTRCRPLGGTQGGSRWEPKATWRLVETW